MNFLLLRRTSQYFLPSWIRECIFCFEPHIGLHTLPSSNSTSTPECPRRAWSTWPGPPPSQLPHPHTTHDKKWQDAFHPLWRRKWQPTPVLLTRKSHGQRSLVSCCPWGRTKSDTTEATEHACMHALEKGLKPTLVFLPGESQGQRSLVGFRLWGHTESDMTEVTWQKQQQLPPLTLTQANVVKRKFFIKNFLISVS